MFSGGESAKKEESSSVTDKFTSMFKKGEQPTASEGQKEEDPLSAFKNLFSTKKKDSEEAPIVPTDGKKGEAPPVPPPSGESKAAARKFEPPKREKLSDKIKAIDEKKEKKEKEGGGKGASHNAIDASLKELSGGFYSK